MVSDKIVQGLLGKLLQKRLIRETARKVKTLQDVVSDCKAAERSTAQAREMNGNQTEAADAVSHDKIETVSFSIVPEGAQVNVIPKSEILKWKEKPLVLKAKQQVLEYSDNLVPIIGECSLACETNKVKEDFKFIVTTLESSTILGLSACEKLRLIKRLYNVRKGSGCSRIVETPQLIIKKFSDEFSGMGRLNREVKFKLMKNCIPNVTAQRKIPLALHDKVKEKLQPMVETVFITKVDEPTKWVNNMVVVNAPKKLRFRLDPRPFNEVIKKPTTQSHLLIAS
ncbi:hypothetical protein AVEN_79938-1 [Araneus ventricosus]|uniref:Uncharacterized protein n=1 Tax=Araneus ventricosus TaxID=182803 RepID=A0A4Y2H2N1_ARAVE|nr:hypothetical protein AVEN_79938-1 [Araneus ventricosus]